MKQTKRKVFYEGSFWGHSGRDHAGLEIPIHQEFVWGDNRWLVPAVYSCAKGLVVELCARVRAEDIRAFMDKWNLTPETDDPRRYTKEQRMTISAENPLNIEYRPTVTVNGASLPCKRGSSICWNPWFPRPDEETQAVMAHYGLDSRDGWVISRHNFPWNTQKRPQIQSLELTMHQNKVAVAGGRFQVRGPGDRVEFVHSVTGRTHTLTVAEYAPLEVPGHMEQHPGMEFPTHCVAMGFILEPETDLTVLDCAESDRPRPDYHGAFGIIGGADGPTALSHKPLHAAISAVHFAPADHVEWRMVFYDQPVADLTVALI